MPIAAVRVQYRHHRALASFPQRVFKGKRFENEVVVLEGVTRGVSVNDVDGV